MNSGGGVGVDTSEEVGGKYRVEDSRSDSILVFSILVFIFTITCTVISCD